MPRPPGRFPSARRPPISTRFSGVGAGQGLVSRRHSPTRLGLVASPPIRPQPGHGFRHSRLFSCRGQGGLPPRRRGARGQPRTLISAESDTRRAESVDIYYCSQESGARGGGGMEARRGRAAGVGPAVGPSVCLCELAKEGGGGGARRLHGKEKWPAGPEASKPADPATPGIVEVEVPHLPSLLRKGDGAAGGGVRGWRGSVPAARPPVTHRTQVHLCRAVAGIKVPYGPSEGGEAGGKQLPARTKRALFQPPPLCRAAAKSPFRNCPPGARARAHAHTDTRILPPTHPRLPGRGRGWVRSAGTGRGRCGRGRGGAARLFRAGLFNVFSP